MSWFHGGHAEPLHTTDKGRTDANPSDKDAANANVETVDGQE
jgi:hypothetical protein